jgi:hypothetical protein
MGPIHVEPRPRGIPNVESRWHVDYLEQNGSVATEPRRRGLFRRAFGSGSNAQVPERQGRSRELDRTIRLPVAGIYVQWDLETSVTVMEWDLMVLTDPTSSVGIYLALAQGRIDGSAFYLGLQTDIQDPGHGRGVGKGLIFSTWWTFDAGATRLAPEGFRELGTHEGRFVGVRRPYRWVVGNYRVTLARSELADHLGVPADWFDLYIQPTAPEGTGPGRPETVGSRTWIGGLAFPRRRHSTPATIEGTSTAFVEVYSGAPRWSDVPAWDVDLMAFGDGQRCLHGAVEYPVFPFGGNRPMPNANARFDPERHQVTLRYGGSTNRIDPAGRWP